MNEETYITTQSQLVTLSSLIVDLPLDEFIQAAQHAEAVGPILDPTLWMQGHRKLANVIRLASAFRQVQREIERQVAEGAKGR